jgi:predicted RNase H-like HicB family nuclease
MNFKVVLQEAEEGGYIVSCPALPGCHSQGDSMDEALENIKEAIAGCLESLAEERTRILKIPGAAILYFAVYQLIYELVTIKPYVVSLKSFLE